MEPIVEEKCEMKVLALSNTQTVMADKNRGTKESDTTNVENKVKFYIMYFLKFYIIYVICCAFSHFYIYYYYFFKIKMV